MPPEAPRWQTAVRKPQPPRTIAPVAAILVATLLFMTGLIWIESENRRVRALQEAARISSERQVALVELLSFLKDSETSQRGYVITGRRDFLGLYPIGRGETRRHLAQLRRAYGGDDRAQRDLGELERIVAAKFAEMDAVIDVRRDQGLRQAAAVVSQGRGRALMLEARAMVRTMIAAERRIGRAEWADYFERQQLIEGLLRAGALAVTILLAVGGWMLWRIRRGRYLADLAAYDAATRQRTIFDSTNDAILILNPSGTIETVNAAGRKLLGFDGEDTRRQDVSTILDLADGPGSFHERIGLVDGVLRNPIVTGRTARRVDGSPLAVDVSLGVMDLPDGVHVVASLRDMTERARVERLKDDLVSTVSHELRTPLTSVIGALGLLRAGAAGVLGDEAAKLVEIAENNSRRLIRLINDMLDIDRIENGQLRMARRPLDLRSIAQRAASDAEGLARDQVINVVAHVPEETVPVNADEGRLLQVMTNLLGNAIKAAPPESTVEVVVERIGGKARVAVDDRGPGIPQEFRGRIFGRFERSRDVEASGAGSGLGLAISREIVLGHGGEIWFEDRPEGGTRFAFSIDLDDGVDKAAEEEARCCILICEDDPDALRVLQSLVSAEGCACDTAGSAEEARTMLRARAYDGLLLDLNLPGESGLEFARSIRADPDLRHLPIVVVTGRDKDQDDGLCALDIVDWITKPVDIARLGAALDAVSARIAPGKPCVLHLDDDQDTLDVTGRSLSPDAQMLQATDLATARAILNETTPDLVIIDVNLPIGSGLDLLPLLVDGAGVPIPAIIYSAQDVSAATARRVNAVLTKSKDSLPDLRRTVRRVFAGHHRGGNA